MKRFKTVHYTIHSNKIKDARGIRFAVLADLHGMEFFCKSTYFSGIPEAAASRTARANS